MRLIDADWLLDVIENIIVWDTERDKNRAIHQVRELTPTIEEQRWTPISERLPETPIRVQAQLDNDWIITAYYDDGEWYDVPGDGEPIDGVLAWMPLPKPYVEGKK